MAPQVSRLLIVCVALVGLFFGAKSQLAPKSFGEKGFYPSDAPKKLAARQMSFAGKSACMECHSDIVSGSPHVKIGVSCETCHGPAKAHADDFDEYKPFVPSTRAFCLRCHAMITGRPDYFPQVDPQDHHPGELCTKCHQIHPKEAS